MSYELRQTSGCSIEMLVLANLCMVLEDFEQWMYNVVLLLIFTPNLCIVMYLQIKYDDDDDDDDDDDVLPCAGVASFQFISEPMFVLFLIFLIWRICTNTCCLVAQCRLTHSVAQCTHERRGHLRTKNIKTLHDRGFASLPQTPLGELTALPTHRPPSWYREDCCPSQKPTLALSRSSFGPCSWGPQLTVEPGPLGALLRHCDWRWSVTEWKLSIDGRQLEGDLVLWLYREQAGQFIRLSDNRLKQLYTVSCTGWVKKNWTIFECW